MKSDGSVVHESIPVLDINESMVYSLVTPDTLPLCIQVTHALECVEVAVHIHENVGNDVL